MAAKIGSFISIKFSNRSSFSGHFSYFTTPSKYELKIFAHFSSSVITLLPSVSVRLSLF